MFDQLLNLPLENALGFSFLDIGMAMLGTWVSQKCNLGPPTNTIAPVTVSVRFTGIKFICLCQAWAHPQEPGSGTEAREEWKGEVHVPKDDRGPALISHGLTVSPGQRL